MFTRAMFRIVANMILQKQHRGTETAKSGNLRVVAMVPALKLFEMATRDQVAHTMMPPNVTHAQLSSPRCYVTCMTSRKTGFR
jgi:hypothetical protein